MFERTLEKIKCLKCKSGLKLKPEQRGENSQDVWTGEVVCAQCSMKFPIISGVLLFVHDAEEYIRDHFKGFKRELKTKDFPKKLQGFFEECLEDYQEFEEHIEEDLEASRVNALYLMTHYLKGSDVGCSSPEIKKLISEYWDRGPFFQIKKLISENHFQNQELLELGCGAGGLYFHLSHDLKSYLGVDSAFTSILTARRIFFSKNPEARSFLGPEDLIEGSLSRKYQIVQEQISGESVDFIVADVEKVSFKENSFDLCVAMNVIDMLWEPEKLAEIQFHALSIGGVAFQSSPYIWHPKVALNLKKKFPKQTSSQAVMRIFEKKGFKISHSQEFNPWLFFKNDRQIELYSTHIFLAKKMN